MLSVLISNNIRIYPDNIELEEDLIKLNIKKLGFLNSLINYKLDDKCYLCYLYTKEDCKEKLMI